MKNNILGYEMLDCKKIKKSQVKKAVRKKLETKDEVIIMKKSKVKKLAVIGAVIGTALLSLTTVNAATDGAVVDKISDTFSNIRIFVNGKEVDKDDVNAVLKYDDGDTIVFEVEGDENGEITIEGIYDESEECEVTINEYRDTGEVTIDEEIKLTENSDIAAESENSPSCDVDDTEN